MQPSINQVRFLLQVPLFDDKHETDDYLHHLSGWIDW
jgi:hypothetical protein